MYQPKPAPRDHNQPGARLDVEALCHFLEEKGLAWADASAATDALEDARKSVFAEALLRAEGKTVGEREASALTDNAYQRHLKALDSARRTSNRAKVAYDVAKVRVELARSNASTERALAVLR
jgi:hypothetical protein